MINVSLDKFNLNKFWEKTPAPLKYILVFVLFLTVSYFFISKNIEDSSVKELNAMKTGIKATYELVDNFEKFKQEQTAYNEQILNYIHDLHLLVQELNANTNRKLDMILSSGNVNSENILEKIQLLNETFEKLAKVYQNNLDRTNVPNSERGVYSQPEIRIRKIIDTVKK